MGPGRQGLWLVFLRNTWFYLVPGSRFPEQIQVFQCQCAEAMARQSIRSDRHVVVYSRFSVRSSKRERFYVLIFSLLFAFNIGLNNFSSWEDGESQTATAVKGKASNESPNRRNRRLTCSRLFSCFRNKNIERIGTTRAHKSTKKYLLVFILLSSHLGHLGTAPPEKHKHIPLYHITLPIDSVGQPRCRCCAGIQASYAHMLVTWGV